MYRINDVVVYRRNVCRIVGIHRSDFSGEKCYILVPNANPDGTVKMQVPVSNKGGHLRNVLTEEEIRKLIEEVPAIDTLISKPANMKSQYAALMKSDDVRDLIRIMKTSYARNAERLANHKKLASIDDEYLQKAESCLFEEMAVSLGVSYEEAKLYFQKEVKKIDEE